MYQDFYKCVEIYVYYRILSNAKLAIPLPNIKLNIHFHQVNVLRRFANDPRPEVRECMFPIREGKDSWIQLIAPVNDSCPDNGEIFCEVVRTLLDKAPVRRKLIRQLAHYCVDAFRLMVIRGDDFFVRVRFTGLFWGDSSLWCI